MNQKPAYEEINELISQGENSAVEFKSSEFRNEVLAKEIVSFANTNGGIILIGINDDKTITGIEKIDEQEERVVNIARSSISPAMDIQCHKISIENKNVLLITIPKGKDKPYQTNDNRFYLRIGSTCRAASQSELLRLFQASGLFHYDNIALENTSIKNLNLYKIDSYFKNYSVNFEEESEENKLNILKNSKILTSDLKASIAGMLLFGINPATHLPQSGISFAHFKGTHIDSELIDKQNIEGTLDFQIDTGLAVIKNNLLVPSTIIGTKRTDSKIQYSDKTIRELITNACVHRNYSIAGSKIRIFIYDDRIEFISPGRLPNTIEIEQLKAGVSFAINPILVKFMENMRYIEHLGRGLPMVWQEVQKLKKKVEFVEIGENFKVILYL